MPIPSNLETCIVKGQYLDFEGNPASGAVVLKFPVFVRDPGADVILVPFDIVRTLDSQGAFSVTIPVNNDPDAEPQGWELTVKEDFPGGRTRSFPVPAGTVELDLADIADTSPVPDPGDSVYASFAALSAEIADRAQGDADTLASAQAYSDAGDAELVPESSRNLPNGFAGLDGSGDVLGSVIPDSLGGHKTFVDGASSSLAPTLAAHLSRKDYVDGLDAGNVKLTGTQTVSGAKTFTTSVLAERAAATDIGFRGQVVGDAVLRAVYRVDGRLEVGDGAVSRDTFMERTAAGVWQATSQVRVTGAAPSNAADLTRKDYVDTLDGANVKLTGNQSIAGIKTFTQRPRFSGGAIADMASLTDTAYNAIKTGDPFDAWRMLLNGKMEWGTGGIARDAFLERIAAGVLQVTSQIRVTGSAPSNAADLTRKDYVDGLDAANVKMTGAQSVAGLKTFTSGMAGTTLRLTSTDDATLTSTTHAFQIGADGASNMKIDNNEIRTQVNGVVDSLFIQPDGGNVSLFFTKSVGSITDKLEVKGKVESSTNRTLMNWVLLSTLGTFGTNFSADPTNPPMMAKFIENEIEVWRYKGRFAVTSGTMTPDAAFTAFTFTNTSEHPSSERGFSAFGSNSQFFPVRAGLSAAGVLSVGVPSESANSVTGFGFDWAIHDPKLTDVS